MCCFSPLVPTDGLKESPSLLKYREAPTAPPPLQADTCGSAQVGFSYWNMVEHTQSFEVLTSMVSKLLEQTPFSWRAIAANLAENGLCPSCDKVQVRAPQMCHGGFEQHLLLPCRDRRTLSSFSFNVSTLMSTPKGLSRPPLPSCQHTGSRVGLSVDLELQQVIFSKRSTCH